MSFVGINIGALTVKVVAVRGAQRIARVAAHQGRPLPVLDELLAAAEFFDAEFFGVSGLLGHIPEAAAIEPALRETGTDFDAVVSLGGESFLVYLLTGQHITHVLSHNKCAAGSGEFFVQQIGRMGLTLDEAIRLSAAGQVVPLASRCSVHCKSDITHKLNRNEATPADILRTLHDSMAGKVAALLEKGQCDVKTVLLIGGVTRNAAMLAAPGQRMGIPRALTTHSLFPLYATFFSRLGFAVVLSDVDGRGDLKAHSSFCFPAQLAHGAVLDLTRRGVRWVFLPHLVRMPQAGACRDSYLCPITQASPYFLAKAFPEIRLLSPELDFTHGYAASTALIEMAAHELGSDRQRAGQAWSAAVAAQQDVEAALGELGRRALAEALAAGKPAIVLAGRSYNAFTPEASQSVGKKLSSVGVTVIPADCLPPAGDGPTVWHFANQIMNAVATVQRHPQLFLLGVSNFSCTIDAFTHAMLASELGDKPYLMLEIDAHTADAGVQTRLEAFLDIIANYQRAQAGSGPAFTPCRLGRGGVVTRSNGQRVRLTDPRVKIYFPNFSHYHAEAFALAAAPKNSTAASSRRPACWWPPPTTPRPSSPRPASTFRPPFSAK